MSKRARRAREIPEYAAMVRRVIRAHGRRVGDADPEDLAELVAMAETLDEAIALAVAGQRDNGFAWSQIGRGLGITRQAAQQRYMAHRVRPLTPNHPSALQPETASLARRG